MQLYKDNLGKVALTVSESYWDINKDYDKLLIIEVEGQYQTYVSRKPVPAGTQITDRRYWIPFSSLKEEIKLNYAKWFNIYGSLIDSNANTLNNLQLQLNELTKNLPGLHLSGNISEFEIGVPTNIILTFGTNDGKKAKFNLYGNGVLIESFHDSEVTFNTTTDETVEFKVECIQYGVTYESTWNVAAIAPYYIGAGEIYEDVLGVADWKRGAKSDISGLYSINVENSNKKFFVCIPSFIVVDSIKMNGFDVPMKNPVDTTYNGIAYKVLESENFYSIGEHNIQINQYQGDESDLLYSLIATVNTFDDRIDEAEENAQEAKDKILNVNDEDITVDNEKNLILADKQYDADDYSGLGRKYLRKKLVNGVNVLTQEMLNKANTIYHIQYDYDLNGAEITIPEGCVFEFDGGSLSNGTLDGNNTIVKGIAKLNLTLTGTFIYYVPNNIQLIESGSTKPNNPTTGQRSFDTSLDLPIYWDGSKWVDSRGYTAAPHKGTTTQRNALVLDASTDIGFDFYDTTLGVKLYAGAIDSNGAVTRWLDEEGYTYHLKSGYERPTNLTIFDNYMPFYDLNLEMMIYAHISGSGSGTTIVWKDIDGHTPLPKTATLNNSSAATYLGATHAAATSDDIGMEVWITDKNKVAYLGDVVTAGSIVQHKWYYADGTVALDESQAPTPSV